MAWNLGATIALGALVRKALTSPTQVKRAAQDLGHAAGDIVHRRTALQIYPREAVKKVSRACEDLKYDWKKALRR